MSTFVPYSKKYRLGRGVVDFDPLTSGLYEGAFRLGNCPEFTLTLEGQKLEHVSSEQGLSETDLDKVIGITRTANITCDNMSDKILEVYLAGTTTTITQAAATVTNEALGNVKAGRKYRLGVTTVVPDGVRGISAVTLAVSASNFVVSTPYTVGQVLLNPTPDAFIYLVTVAGTSAGTLPTFPGAGASVASGATIKNIGSTAFVNVSDFTFDTTLGHVNVLETGAIAALIAQIAALSGTLALKVNYTKSASTTQQIKTGAAAGLTGQLTFYAEDPLDPGVVTEWVFPSVSLSPDGDLGLITGDELQSASFSVGISIRDSSMPAIKRNGMPVFA